MDIDSVHSAPKSVHTFRNIVFDMSSSLSGAFPNVKNKKRNTPNPPKKTGNKQTNKQQEHKAGKNNKQVIKSEQTKSRANNSAPYCACILIMNSNPDPLGRLPSCRCATFNTSQSPQRCSSLFRSVLPQILSSVLPPTPLAGMHFDDTLSVPCFLLPLFSHSFFSLLSGGSV